MILFEFNDVFGQFTNAFTAKFGKAPNEMTEAEYNTAVSSLVRTDFYSTLPRVQVGIDLLKWALNYRDKNVQIMFVDEAKSPTWVNSEKLAYVDAICADYGLPRLDFSRCRTPGELAGHAYRGPLVSRDESHVNIWNASTGRPGYRAVYMSDILEFNQELIEASFQEHG